MKRCVVGVAAFIVISKARLPSGTLFTGVPPKNFYKGS